MSDALSTEPVSIVPRQILGNGRRFAIVSTLAVAAVAALAALSLVAIHRELTESALARRAALSDLAAATLAEKFDRAIDVGVSLATRVRFRDLIEAGRWSEAAAILRDAPGNFAYIERIGLFDLNGVLVADVPEVSSPKRPVLADRDWFKAVLRDGKPGISVIFKRRGEPTRNVFVVTAPIRSGSGALLGVLAGQIPVEGFFSWLNGINVGEDGLIYVLDRAGTLAFHSRLETGNADLRDYSSVPAVQSALQGKRGVEIALNLVENEERVTAYSPIARHGWGVVVAEPTAAVFETRNRLFFGAVAAYLLILTISGALFSARIARQRERAEEGRRIAAERERRVEEGRRREQETLARQSERLRIKREIDRATVAEETSHSIAEAAIQPLRDLLGVPRAIVNLFHLGSGEVEWLAAAGRKRLHTGTPVRYSIQFMGDLAALARGETQVVDTRSLPAGPEVDALLASGVFVYMVVPMIAGGELIGAISFGGENADFSSEIINIARESATQLAIAITQSRLLERVRRQAEQLEQRVAERTAQLELANKELESFSYSVSHDLRTPLRAVDGYALMLQEDYSARLDDEGRRLLGVVRGEAARMGQLIDDLLWLSRTARQPLLVSTFDMSALVREVIELLSSEYPKARIDLAALPQGFGDRSLLRQVWMNLIGNALKYSAKQSAPRLQIGGRENSDANEYWVKDNGAGFDPRYASKLFGVFQRLHNAEEFAGTGVGLAIVQRVVTSHGGRVWAEGAPGQGATFSFALPNRRAP